MSSSGLAQQSAAAEKLFMEGQQLLEQGKHEQACTKLKASMDLEPAAGTALNLARCNQLRGKIATAWADYKRAETLFRARGDDKREQFARDQAAELEPGLPMLTIRAPAIDGLVVRRNDVEVPPSALDTAVPVDPGKHVIAASAPGHQPWSTELAVGATGGAQEITIPALTPEPEGAEPKAVSTDSAPSATETNALVVTGGVLAGVGAVTAIVGGVLGGMVLGEASEAEEDEALCGPDKLCTPEGLEQIDSAEGKALGANVLIGVGSAVAVGGVVLLIVGLTSEGDAEIGESARLGAELTPVVGPEGASLQVVGTF
ncbi:MAG: hypothetical protein JRI23_15705 [Deltaproteobacteria bacterium]|jgi:hypothetical protein|nr:hypothetical protein [Deltaproteobacteria bacterium]MBW2533206.1 hypothetical protein [Deltaproteobacteria bacterium]